MTSKAGKPIVLVASNKRLFESFFDLGLANRLSESTRWERNPARTITPALRRALGNAEALITTWDSPPHFSQDLLTWAPSLRIIAHCGGGVKTRFARPLFDRLVITNAAEPMARHVAELAVTFLLYLARNIDRYRKRLRRPSNAIYQQMHRSGGGEETILGREVGMIGFGQIGRAVADLLAPFGVRLLVHDPYVRSNEAHPFVRLASLKEVLTASHFLILAAGLTPETEGMLDLKRLRMLPQGASIINVARGGIINLEALTPLVLCGRLRCALDVTDPHEPLALRHPLRRAEGAILTPHIGSISGSVRRAIASVVLSDIEQFFSGQPVKSRVTQDMLDRMT
jgi:phosphoglycerate dehydrogenase-like enzyme